MTGPSSQACPHPGGHRMFGDGSRDVRTRRKMPVEQQPPFPLPAPTSPTRPPSGSAPSRPPSSSASSTPDWCRQPSNRWSSAWPSPTAASPSSRPACGSSPRATPSAPPPSASYGAFWLSFWWLTGHTAVDKIPRGRRRQGRRALPARLGHLHRLHDRSRDPGQRRGARGVRAADADLPDPGLGRVRRRPPGITKIGGYVGLLTALAAWYASFAGVTAFTFKRQLLPVGPR